MLQLKRNALKIGALSMLSVTAISMLSVGSANAAQDLVVSSIKMGDTARSGNCNQVIVKITNKGDVASRAIKSTYRSPKAALVTHPSGNAFQGRFTKHLYLPPIRPGDSRSINLSKIGMGFGPHRVSVAIDTSDVPQDPVGRGSESSRSINVSSNSLCTPLGLGTRLTGRTGDCDLALSFLAPTGNPARVDAGEPFTVRAKIRNLSSGDCAKNGMRLQAFSGTQATGSSRFVGGVAAVRSIPALGQNESKIIEWDDEVNGSNTFQTYQLKFTGSHNDANNNNHTRVATTVRTR